MKKRRNVRSLATEEEQRGLSLLTAEEQRSLQDLRSEAPAASEQARQQAWVDTKRAELRDGLTRRQRIFVLEKLVGQSDKDAALAAGYSLSVACGECGFGWRDYLY
jgi:hypothetical protein